MRSKTKFTPKEAAEIRRLLSHRLRASRAGQKADRDVLRKQYGFWISDFKRGLTASGFDELVDGGKLSIVL